MILTRLLASRMNARSTGPSGRKIGKPVCGSRSIIHREVSRARGAVARYLAACPVADDAVLIASELAANAVVHSGSRGQFFAVRCAMRGSSPW